MKNTNFKKITLTSKDKKYFSSFFMIADMHIGIKLGAAEWIENMRDYFENFFIPLIKKEKKKGDICIVCGDVYDDRKSVNLEANDLAIEVFEKIAKELPVIIINGNHDMYKKSDNKITSLRSLENIPNVTIIKEPTIITLSETKKMPQGYDEMVDYNEQIGQLAFIPYQGDMERETDLCNACKNADYIFMHTDIKNLRYDNGRDIIKGVEVGEIKGHIYSGHIHKRQETEKVTYIGSPYQLRRSDIGNNKGIYHVNIDTKYEKFYENNISPIFQKVWLSDLLTKPFSEIKDLCKNNYTDILVKTEELENLNITKVYDVLVCCKPKRVLIKDVNSNTNTFDGDDDENYKEMSIPEIIDNLIDKMEEPDEKKQRLKELSSKYQDLLKVEIDD